MSDEALVKEMEHYSDLFIEEVRVGHRSTFPGESNENSINVGLTVLCVEDDHNTIRLTATARFGTDDVLINDVHAVLFKTIDHGEEAIAKLYPPDNRLLTICSAPPGEIADDKKKLAAKYIIEFVDKLKERDIQL
mmetsp:Transcript_7061/g.14615  ORF Transcript_7061/g.14615 Transcript_7061/m.14615 type:complete len:135 (-) Transcript_7061:242-646(-)